MIDLCDDLPYKLGDELKARIASRRVYATFNQMQPISIPRLVSVLTTLRWVDKRTVGKFYIEGRQISFVEKNDDLAFRLGFL